MPSVKPLALALSCLPLALALACGQHTQPVERGAHVDVSVTVDEDTADAEACALVCTPCPPGQICTQVCHELGTCNLPCGLVIDCAGGTHFDEDLCACVPDDDLVGTPCGPELCAVGEVCCNWSCGICTEPNGACTQQYCPPELPGEACGDIICPVGTECCNASCGICVPPGGACTQQACD